MAGETPIPNDGTFLAAEALRPLFRDDAIKAGPSQQAIVAKATPQLSDDDVRDLALTTPQETFVDYVKAGAKIGAIGGIGLATMTPFIILASPIRQQFGIKELLMMWGHAVFLFGMIGAAIGSLICGACYVVTLPLRK